MAQIESIIPTVNAPVPAGRKRRGARGMDERRLITAAGAGVVAFAGAKYGILKMIPAIGPAPAALVTIAVGVVLAAWVDKAGTAGAIIEGAGYGLIAVGAFELATA